MSEMKVQGVVHWSIPVNSLEESEKFYGETLGLESKGRLGNSNMSCFKAGDHNILLCERKDSLVRTPQQDNRLHHAFMVGRSRYVGARRQACPELSRRAAP